MLAAFEDSSFNRSGWSQSQVKDNRRLLYLRSFGRTVNTLKGIVDLTIVGLEVRLIHGEIIHELNHGDPRMSGVKGFNGFCQCGGGVHHV